MCTKEQSIASLHWRVHEAHEVNMMKIQKGYANYWEIIISSKKKKKEDRSWV